MKFVRELMDGAFSHKFALLKWMDGDWCFRSQCTEAILGRGATWVLEPNVWMNHTLDAGLTWMSAAQCATN